MWFTSEYPREDLTKSCNVLREPFQLREGFSWMNLKVNLGRLETRLNCVELAGELDTGEGGLYTVQGSTQTRGYCKGKLSHLIREIVTKEGAIQ